MIKFSLTSLPLVSLFIIVFTLSFILFSDSINAYFSQDDFFHLRAILDKKISDIPSFFISKNEEYGFYRPLSRETFNIIMYKLFNLNPLPFHLVNFSLIIFNTLLIYFLLQNIPQYSKNVYFSPFIYLISAVHSIELYYLGAIQLLTAGTLLLTSTLFYILFLKKKILNFYLLSILLFSISLFCHEMAVIFPGIILLINICFQNSFKSFKNSILNILPFILFAIIYIISTATFFDLPHQAAYQPIFNPKNIINTFSWYLVWSFNLPEMLVDFIGPKLAINPNLILWFKQYIKITFSLLTFVILSILFITFYNLKEIIDKKNLFGLGAFIIALSPFLFFPQHKFIYYLSFAIIWFSIFIGQIISITWSGNLIIKIWIILILCSLGVISYSTIQLNKTIYWAAKRAQAAKYLVDDIKANYPILPKGAVYYFKNDPKYPVITKEWGSSSKQAFFILSGADALKLIYDDLTIKAYFEDINSLPEDLKSSKIINFEAKFPY